MEALLFRKKGHKTDIFPVLQKLTHMCYMVRMYGVLDSHYPTNVKIQ